MASSVLTNDPAPVRINFPQQRRAGAGKRRLRAYLGLAAALAIFTAGDWFGSRLAVDAFLNKHDSPTAPTGYRCWDEIQASAPSGVEHMCGTVSFDSQRQ